MTAHEFDMGNTSLNIELFGINLALLKSKSLCDKTIIREFTRYFDTDPTFFIQAPGRVNLIGEHTDYNGFPVLPISIPQTISLAGIPRNDSVVTIANTDSHYQQTSFELSQNIPHSKTGYWANYVKAACQALTVSLGENLTGMDLLFHGVIPVSAGLSSSSALVIASALALLASNKQRMDTIELAELMAGGEHYVGTQGGGMDQAICLLGRKYHAVRIGFFPLRFSYFPFPKDHSIIVAHSLIRAAKTENALFLYNRRPAECRLATAIINAVYHPKHAFARLGELPEDIYGSKHPEDFVSSIFTRESYTLQDISGFTGETAEMIIEKYLLTWDGKPMPVPSGGFLIRQRALHILTEAGRVMKSCIALNNNDMTGFGRLMNASHESCDKNYGISTPELNTLVSIMRNLGALGARLTGAGFGGCAVALIKDENVRPFTDGIRQLYYKDYIGEKHPELGEIDDYHDIVFAVKPSAGATVTNL